MKKYVFIMISMLLLCSFKGRAQHTFSTYIDYNRYGEFATTVFFIPGEGYLSSARSVDFFTIDTFTYATDYQVYFKLNLQGDTVWKKIYRKPHYQIQATRLINYKNGYLMAGHIFDLVKHYEDSVGSFVYLVNINSTGDTLWTKMIDVLPGDEYSQELIHTSDHGYAITGASCTKDEKNCDFFLIKLDSNANEQWKKRYTYSSTTFEDAYSVAETKDKGFMILGYTSPIGSGNNSFYLVKTDSLGNKQWHKKYPNNNLSRIGLGITKLKDGNYLLCGVTKNIPPVEQNALAIKIDTAGNIVWEKQYGGTEYDNFDKPIELQDGSIIFAGNSRSYNDRGDGDGWLFKITADGDSVWQRVYDSWKVGDTDIKPDRFYGITKTDDGFVMAGYGDNPTGSPINQDAWILKVDSFGCLVPGCQNVGIENRSINIIPLTIYPNPAKESLAISHQLPVIGYRVYDLLGKIMAEGNYNKEIDVRKLPAGNYLIQAELENLRIAYGRFAKE